MNGLSINRASIAAACLAVVIGVSVAKAADQSATTAQSPQPEQFPEMTERGSVTAPAKIAPGKTISFNGTLRTGKNEVKARATSACVVTSSSGAQCTYTVRTSRGQLTAAGFLPIRGGTLPIIGGTGAYQGVEGELSRRDSDDAILVTITLR